MHKLEDLRNQIDSEDKQLLETLSRRFALTRKIGKIKKQHNLSAKDSKREAEIIKNRLVLAKKMKIDPKFVQKLFQAIFKQVIREHQRIKKES